MLINMKVNTGCKCKAEKKRDRILASIHIQQSRITFIIPISEGK